MNRIGGVPTPIVLPSLGPQIRGAVVVQWRKNVGQQVVVNEVVVDVSCERGLISISAPMPGRLVEIRANRGTMVSVGNVLGVLAPVPPAGSGDRPLELTVSDKMARLMAWRNRRRVNLSDQELHRIAAAPKQSPESILKMLPGFLQDSVPEIWAELTGGRPPGPRPAAQPGPVRPGPDGRAGQPGPVGPRPVGNPPGQPVAAVPPRPPEQSQPGGRGAESAQGPGIAMPRQPPAQPVPGPRPAPSAPVLGQPENQAGPLADQPVLAARRVQPAASSEPGQSPGGVDGRPLATAPQQMAQPPVDDKVLASCDDFERLMDELMRFAPYDYSGSDSEPTDLRLTRLDNGQVTISWPAPEKPDKTELYRLVCADDQPPTSPDSADQLAVLTGRQFTDTRPHTSAVRCYQVWRNSGSGPDAARAAQPVLHASGVHIEPPTEVELLSEGNSIIGRWRVGQQTRKVLVFRIPKEKVTPHTLRDPRFQILTDQDNLRGLVDTEASPGQEYAYKVVAEVAAGDQILQSKPVIRYIRVNAPLEPVADLVSIPREGDPDNPLFDLEWTRPPVGNVLIFRTTNRPSDEALLRSYDEAALAQMGLSPRAWLRQPVEDLPDGRQALRAVPWPVAEGADQARLYLTPVTQLDGRVRVGKSVVQVVAGRILEPRLAQRVSYQMLTFGWPSRASIVRVYVSQPGVTAAQAIAAGEPVCSLSQQQYDIQGGVLLHDLPDRGCAIHAQPSTLDPAGEVLGDPVTVHYPGLLQIRYQIGQQQRLFKAQQRAIALSSSYPVQELQFKLIYHPDRLPLDEGDGEAWHLAPAQPEQAAPPGLVVTCGVLGPEPGAPLWQFHTGGRTGWVRLFAVGMLDQGVGRALTETQKQALAVLDPPIDQLWLGR